MHSGRWNGNFVFVVACTYDHAIEHDDVNDDDDDKNGDDDDDSLSLEESSK